MNNSGGEPASIPSQQPPTSALRAILCTMLGYFSFNVSDGLLKSLAGTFSVAEILLVNSLIVGGIVAVIGAVHQGRAAFLVRSWAWIGLRSLLAVATTTVTIYALPHITLTAFYTLVFTSPFLVAVLSALFLGERLALRRALVIAGGFAIIAGMLRPGGDLLSVWSFWVLGSTAMYSCSVILLRYLGTRETRTMLLLVPAVLMFFAAIPFLPEAMSPVTPMAAVKFLANGIAATAGIYCIAYAFHTAPSVAVIAPFHYTQMIWGAVIGYVFFSEVPKLEVVTGCALLVAGGLLLLWMDVREVRRSPQVARHPFQSAGWFSRLRAYTPTRK